MRFEEITLLWAGGLFIAMLALLEIGRRFGLRRTADEGERGGTGVVEGAVFALLGLLVAFTFSGAASRFDDRRKLITEEANAIGTAWLRLDLLPPAERAELRASFRRYVDARLAVYKALPDSPRRRPSSHAPGVSSRRSGRRRSRPPPVRNRRRCCCCRR